MKDAGGSHLLPLPQAARSGLTGYFPIRKASYPEEHPCLSLASAERLWNEELGPQGGPRTPPGPAGIPPPGSSGIWLPASLPRADWLHMLKPTREDEK